MIYSKFKEEHVVHLKLVLQLLTKEKLFVKFSKCEFWLQEVHFLRHVVKSNGIHVNPSKIKAVKIWKVPETPSRIRSFLGLAGEASKVENIIAEMLCGLDQLMERKEDEGADKTYYDLRDMYGGQVLKRILLHRFGLAAYRLRFPEELSSVHVPLDKIKVDKTLHFVGEPVDIMDHKVKSLKGSKISIVKVRWNLKRGPDIHVGLLENITKCLRDTFGYDWDVHLPLAEFSYNNSYLRVFDVLCLRHCMEGNVGRLSYGLKMEKVD
nr:putative reverse transcriptase domain-containing protein [Tanacetum cinerariifolium]